MSLPQRAITPRSLAVSLCAMVLLAIVIQVGGIHAVKQSVGRELGTEVLSLPAIALFTALSLVGGLVFAMTRIRFLNRPESLCVLFCCLIASPLMSHGFWRYILASASTIPRTSDFEKLDAFPSKFWPHGINLLEGKLKESGTGDCTISGHASWREIQVPEGSILPAVTLFNGERGEEARIRFRLPVGNGELGTVSISQPYLATILVRPIDLGPDSHYFSRIYIDDSDHSNQEIFASTAPSRTTYLQPEGFIRTGLYGLTFPSWGEFSVMLEFGLSGEGTVEWADPQLISTEPLESAYRGRKIITQAEYDKLPENLRSNLIIKPENPLSLAGLRFLFTGYFPSKAWLQPTLAWGGFVVLLLIATFTIGTIMRRQWLQNERYPLPLAQVTAALIGVPKNGGGPVSEIWVNRMFWLGFAITFAWCAVKGWHFYDSNVPDARVWIHLKAYFSDPRWGRTFDDIEFKVYAVMVGAALLMELNVLFSLFLGFFLFRFQYWFGEANGLTIDQNYPYAGEQMVGAYLGFAFFTLFIVRKHLWTVLCKGWNGEGEGGGKEALSSRSALIVLFSTFIGIIFWAKWAGLPFGGLLLVYLFWVLIAFVAMRFRAECGTPYSEFFIVNNANPGVILIPFLGGIAVFGPDGLVFAGLSTVFLGSACFLFLPGLQLELLELGHRFNVKRSHIAGIAALGVAGGFAIGGWAYLSSSYGVGADNYPMQFEYSPIADRLKLFTTEMLDATDAMKVTTTGDMERPAKALEGPGKGLLFGSGVAFFLTFLRQIFAGFWFHPIGFILGATSMMRMAWGSLLLAWFVRLLVLKIGGAAAVREKLRPFAIGVFLASVAIYALFGLLNAWIFYEDPSASRYTGLF